VDHVLESAGLPQIRGEDRDRILASVPGLLTTIEAESAFALSVVETRGLDPAVIAREKSRAVKKSGLPEPVLA